MIAFGMDDPCYYRNKLQYPCKVDKDGNKIMGVFAKNSHDVIETSECKIQNKKIQEIANDTFEFFKNNNISVYDEEKLKGILRHIVIRIGIKTNEVMVCLVLNENKFELEKEYVEYIVNKHPEIKTIVKNINSKNTNVILGKENHVIYGTGYIYDEILGNRFKISNMSFYQVNPIQTEKLYSKVIEYASLSGKETIFDLY